MLSRRITGAGILFFTTIRKELCLIVGREKNKSRKLGYKVFEDFGGGIDKGETIKKAATREAYEETCKTLFINNLEARKTFSLRYYKYRLYFVRLENNFSTKLTNTFNNNRNQLVRDNINRHFLEIDKIDYIPVSNLFNKNKYSFQTMRGYSKTRRMRVVEIKNFKKRKIIFSDRLTEIFYPGGKLQKKIQLEIQEIINNLKITKLRSKVKKKIITFTD